METGASIQSISPKDRATATGPAAWVNGYGWPN